MTDSKSEAERLERLWSGDFGDAYVDRNAGVAAHREPFWRSILGEFPARTVLEVGCNLGGNLTWIGKIVEPASVYGVDVNVKALATLRQTSPRVNPVFAVARELPFRDRWFDLTFTMGVLIHQPPEVLPLVMAEVVRCSRRWVLCAEYFAEQPTEVPYRGQTGALFKRDFGAMYEALFPELKLRKKGFLGKDEGWDDVTYWVFERADS
jgi:pseudaminic acid biosynthesis-associated methylase